MFKTSSTTTSKLVSNTSYQLFGKAISMLITVATTVIVSRFYGRQGYGEFNLMQVWPAFVFIIVDFGFNAIAARDIAKDHSLAEKYFNAVLLLRIGISAFFMILMFFVLNYFPYSTELIFGIRLNLLLILTQALFASTNVVFQPLLRYDLSTVGYLIGYIYVLISVVVLSYHHSSITLISFSYVIGGLITFIVNAYLIKTRLGISLTFQTDFIFLKKLFWQTLPLGITFIFSQINFKSDTLLLSVLRLPSKYVLTNTESIAIYGLPYKIFEVGLVFPTFFMNSAYPILVKHMSESKEKLLATLRKVLLWLFFPSLAIALIGCIFSKYIVSILGGAEFTQSVLVLQLLFAGISLYFLTQPLSWLLVVLDKQKYLPWIYLVSCIFNIVANFFYIPRYSFYASTIITHVSELLVLILLVIFCKKAWKAKYA